ncbi:hypothetical protein STEG23_003988 [Scotinomys teguina]
MLKDDANDADVAGEFPYTQACKPDLNGVLVNKDCQLDRIWNHLDDKALGMLGRYYPDYAKYDGNTYLEFPLKHPDIGRPGDTPLILALKKQRQTDVYEFEASLVYLYIEDWSPDDGTDHI